MSNRTAQAAWIFRPFAALWRLVTFSLGMTGHLVAVVMGAVLMVAGALCCATVIGAVIGTHS